jgi:hypothetical protein
MLTLFQPTSEATPPVLPDLHIEDSVSAEDMPVAGIEGWDSDYIQVISICNAPCDLQGDGTQLAVNGASAQFWCRRLSTLLLSSEFSEAAATAKIRLKFTDKNDKVFVTEELDLLATSIQNGSLYIGEILKYELTGANQVSAIITQISAGTVALYLAGV